MQDEREIVSVRPCSHQRFWITNLTIHPELVGATHSFEHRKRRVRVSLPSPNSNVKSRLENHEQIYVGEYWGGEEDKPNYFLVGVVHVRVEADGRLNIPASALKHPPMRLDLFTDNEQRHLRKLLSDLSEVGTDAYAHARPVPLGFGPDRFGCPDRSDYLGRFPWTCFTHRPVRGQRSTDPVIDRKAEPNHDPEIDRRHRPQPARNGAAGRRRVKITGGIGIA